MPSPRLERMAESKRSEAEALEDRAQRIDGLANWYESQARGFREAAAALRSKAKEVENG